MKKLRILLVDLVVILLAGWVLVTYGQQDCCSLHGGTLRSCDDPANPYDCGYCTWWAWQRAKEASGVAWIPGGLQNAYQWDENALGLEPPLFVGRIPLVGAIAVWEANALPNSPLGHVAYVEEVQGSISHSFRVSEMNYPCLNCVTYRDANNENQGVDFIYPPSDVPVPLWPYTGLKVEYGDPINLQWYGNSEYYDIQFDVQEMDGNEQPIGSRYTFATTFNVQGESFNLYNLEDPGNFLYLVDGTWYWRIRNAGGGAWGEWATFELENCVGIIGGGGAGGPSSDVSIAADGYYCPSEWNPNPTPVPTSTPFPTPTSPSAPTPTSQSTNTPTPEPTADRSQCQDESKTGVYLYAVKNYEGSCAFFENIHPNLGDTPVGDNSATSIRINGEYTAWLYEDANYGGLYDEIGVSEADLSWRSLYGQYSSMRLRVTQHCEDEDQPGIYLYSSKNYGGDCAHFIESCPNLPLMPVSIRILGSFWARIYGKTNYEGPYDEFHESEPDMDWRSLGRQWRSMEVFVSTPPTQTPVSTATEVPATATPLPTATPTPCTLLWSVGDFDCNCVIDVADVMQVASRWRCKEGDGCYDETYDIDHDGDVDVVDIMLVVTHWGETCTIPTPTSTPRPTSTPEATPPR